MIWKIPVPVVHVYGVGGLNNAACLAVWTPGEPKIKFLMLEEKFSEVFLEGSL